MKRGVILAGKIALVCLLCVGTIAGIVYLVR